MLCTHHLAQRMTVLAVMLDELRGTLGRAMWRLAGEDKYTKFDNRRN